MLVTATVTLANPGRPAPRPDLGLIREFDQKVYDAHPLQPFPKAVTFVSGTKTVVFVATKHRDVAASRRLIQEAFDTLRPDFALLEGLHADWGLSPRKWDDRSSDSDGSEVYFAYKLAVARKVPFAGAEPGVLKHFSSLARDPAAVQKLADLLANHKRILVVYGAGHYVQQEDVLIQMLGKPKKVR